MSGTDKPAEFPKPVWTIPGTPGYPAAIENVGGVSAPLLAGFSAALVGLLLDSGTTVDLRWPEQAMLLFVLAVICFIGAIQTTIHARTNAVTPDEMKSWYEELSTCEWKHELVNEHKHYVDEHQKWCNITSILYRVGILAFLLGLTLIVVPQKDVVLTITRMAVISVAAIGFLSELLWILINVGNQNYQKREMQRNLGQVRQHTNCTKLTE